VVAALPVMTCSGCHYIRWAVVELQPPWTLCVIKETYQRLIYPDVNLMKNVQSPSDANKDGQEATTETDFHIYVHCMYCLFYDATSTAEIMH
jgi:hypothetical protein